MSNYFVKATVRFRDCDKSSGIKCLVLDQSYNGFTVHDISDLKDLTDQHRLYSACPRTGKTARVRIFWSSAYSRWVATTSSDDTICDNLLSKPVLKAVSSVGTVTNFGVCSIQLYEATQDLLIEPVWLYIHNIR